MLKFKSANADDDALNAKYAPLDLPVSHNLSFIRTGNWLEGSGTRELNRVFLGSKCGHGFYITKHKSIKCLDINKLKGFCSYI